MMTMIIMNMILMINIDSDDCGDDVNDYDD